MKKENIVLFSAGLLSLGATSAGGKKSKGTAAEHHLHLV